MLFRNPTAAAQATEPTPVSTAGTKNDDCGAAETGAPT
jgi:hypothetical protein